MPMSVFFFSEMFAVLFLSGLFAGVLIHISSK